jgi:uroporphyrinogen-III decarboxylase
MNDWVHENTPWKTFFHTCGSIWAFLDDFAQAGVDILNPVQISASGMEPERLKEKYGDIFVFWGGGVDSQGVLTFGTPEEVMAQTKRNIEILGKNGGYVFNNVHNIQATVPLENLRAFFDAVKGK